MLLTLSMMTTKNGLFNLMFRYQRNLLLSKEVTPEYFVSIVSTALCSAWKGESRGMFGAEADCTILHPSLGARSDMEGSVLGLKAQ